ncbi:alpha/beta-hydrolase [Thozetella sp. PMI_491]|nr:alpha/beta-hydrolase [Thozetella sp. PMI_491]
MALSDAVVASAFLPPPQDLITIMSQRWPGGSISYKQTTICETTPGVKAWSGYISMPGGLLNQLENVHNSFDSNLFFWYFESRNDPANAPTAIYLGGGPGYTSLDSMSGFPCIIGADSNSTDINPFSWNNNVNMLYVDQPAGTGYSYVTIKNGTWDAIEGKFTPLEDGEDMPETNATLMAATMDPSPLETTLNTTAQAARVMWQFAQIFFQEFPEKPTTEDEISIWGTSFGGLWAPAFLSHFITQNELVSNCTHPNENATILTPGTLGIGNGCIDFKIIAESYPHMAYNNTYGIQVYNESIYEVAMHNVTAPNTGCHALVDSCRAAAKEGDPTSQGTNDTVNAACQAASQACWLFVQQSYVKYSDHSTFDIAQINALDDVTDYFTTFYNQRWVQEDLGVRVNFTFEDVSYEIAMFSETGDPMARDISAMEHVINSGANVALIFGDRDYACNWIGGEAVSLVASYPGADAFRAAGYADIVTNSSYNGGLVRQHGRVSFSRVFEAPHAVAAGQLETTSRIFERAMFGQDIATGKLHASDCYSTRGPATTWCRNPVPTARESECFNYKAFDTCTDQQKSALLDGSAIMENFVMVSPRGVKLTDLTVVNVTEEWCR